VTDRKGNLGAGRTGAQAADFAALPQLARRLGVTFEDPGPPRHLTFIGAGGIRLHALDWGGDGPPALFLHGGRLTARTWDYVCLGLRGQVRAVALDMRGHGDSDWADDYTLDARVADIGAVLDELAWSTAHLVGMSLGGLTAAHFAAAASHRVASLVTVDVGPGVVFEATAGMRGFFQANQASDGLETIVDAAMQISSLGDRERVAYRVAAMLRLTESGDWAWAYDDRRPTDYPALLVKVEDMVAAAERLAVPCLVVRGGRSPVFSNEAAARFAARFACGEWVVVPDAGHNVQEDNPAGLIAALMQFWSRHAR
jgi:pimeloyl-ACP methyl ester carboxylesterase